MATSLPFKLIVFIAKIINKRILKKQALFFSDPSVALKIGI